MSLYGVFHFSNEFNVAINMTANKTIKAIDTRLGSCVFNIKDTI